MDAPTFSETLSFRQPILWFLLLGVFAVAIGAQIYFFSRGEGGRGGLIALGVTAAIFLFVVSLLFMTRLDITVDPAGLHTRLYPFEMTFRDLRWEEMTSWKADAINPWQHGGWGLRMGKKSKAYIVSGDQCVVVSLKNGNTLFVGTRKPKELVAALDGHGVKKS